MMHYDELDLELEQIVISVTEALRPIIEGKALKTKLKRLYMESTRQPTFHWNIEKDVLQITICGGLEVDGDIALAKVSLNELLWDIPANWSWEKDSATKDPERFAKIVDDLNKVIAGIELIKEQLTDGSFPFEETWEKLYRRKID